MEVLRHIDEKVQDRNRLHRIRHLVIHRLSLAYYHPEHNPHPVPDDELTPEDVVAFFHKLAVTGFKVPYHVLVASFGEVWQMLPLMAKGNHTGGGYNEASLAVAIVGNTDERPMTPEQYERVTDVCTDLVVFRKDGLHIGGHTDLRPSKRWPDKRCPGRFVNLHAIGTQVAWSLPEDWMTWTQEHCFDRIADRGYQIDVSKSEPAFV